MARRLRTNRPRASGSWSNWRRERFSITDMERTAALASGSSVSRETPYCLSSRRVPLNARPDAQASALSLALSCQNFNELLLPVAGYAGDADDLARADREARTGDRDRVAIA